MANQGGGIPPIPREFVNRLRDEYRLTTQAACYTKLKGVRVPRFFVFTGERMLLLRRVFTERYYNLGWYYTYRYELPLWPFVIGEPAVFSGLARWLSGLMSLHRPRFARPLQAASTYG